MNIKKPDFITALQREIHGCDSEYVMWTDVRDMLIRAAAAALPDSLPAIRLHREIDPDGMTPHIILSLDDDRVTLLLEDVATLRALLLACDENAPIRIGEPLTIPTKLKGGRVVSVVAEEMLAEVDG